MTICPTPDFSGAINKKSNLTSLLYYVEMIKNYLGMHSSHTTEPADTGVFRA